MKKALLSLISFSFSVLQLSLASAQTKVKEADESHQAENTTPDKSWVIYTEMLAPLTSYKARETRLLAAPASYSILH